MILFKRQFIKLILSALLLSAQFVEARQQGVIIYTDIDNGDDSIAVAAPFVSIERFSFVTNVVQSSGKAIRLKNNQVKAVLSPTDLADATIVSQANIAALSKELDYYNKLMERFPRSAAQIKILADQINVALQALRSGNVLVSGRWMSKKAYQASLSSRSASRLNIKVGEKSLEGAQLSSVKEGVAIVRHSGGVASLKIDELSDAQIKALNSTSTSVAISKEKNVVKLTKENPSAKAVAGQDAVAGAGKSDMKSEGVSMKEPAGIKKGNAPPAKNISSDALDIWVWENLIQAGL